MQLPVQGRTLKVPRAARGVAYFTFEELCSKPLGAADYLAIAECFSAVLIDGVPQLTPERRNETVRFTVLIDALYETKVKLYIAAAAPPEQLYPVGDQAFAFQRTASRLVEMQSEEYRQKPHLAEALSRGINRNNPTSPRRHHAIQHRYRQHEVGARRQHSNAASLGLGGVIHFHDAEHFLLHRPDDEPHIERHDGAEPHAGADGAVSGATSMNA